LTESAGKTSVPVTTKDCFQPKPEEVHITMTTTTTYPTSTSTEDDEEDAYVSMASTDTPKWKECTKEWFLWEVLHFVKHRNWKKKLLTVLICLTSICILVDFFVFGHVQIAILAILNWMLQNPFGAVFSFIGLFVVATLLFVPPAILMFAAGEFI
jgi:hypothetical protein